MEKNTISNNTNNTPPESFIETVIGLCEPFHTPNREPFVLIQVDNRLKIISTKSKEFFLHIAQLLYEETGKVPNSNSIKGVISLIEADAVFHGPEKEVYVRVAEHKGSVYVDLVNPEHEQVKITSEGWEIIPSNQSSVYFIRSPRMQPMARPVPNGSFEKLWGFVNLHDPHDRVLGISWLLSTFQPNGPFPILNIQGEQGSGKSTLCKFFRDLVDPSHPVITSLPKSERDLAISSYKSRTLAFDNISNISHWLSDAFCRLSTGGGFATRALYTDDAEAVFDIKMPLIVNGITELFTRHDLSDRAIFLGTSPIPQDKRMPEDKLRARWEEAKPEIMGALFTAVSVALRNLDKIEMQHYPRMADFAHWVVSAEPALPWSAGTFLREYNINRLKIVDNAIDFDPVAAAVMSLLKAHSDWSGTPTDLLSSLNNLTPIDTRRLKIWPKRPNTLSMKLRRCMTFLREKGIEVEFSKSGERNITILNLNQIDNQLPAPLQADPHVSSELLPEA